MSLTNEKEVILPSEEEDQKKLAEWIKTHSGDPRNLSNEVENGK